MFQQLIRMIKDFFKRLFSSDPAEQQNIINRGQPPVTQQKKFEIEGIQDDPRPVISYERCEGGKFEIEGERVITPPIHTEWITTRPKTCPNCQTKTEFSNHIERLESGEWKCKECEYTWR